MEESLIGIKCWEIEVPPACDRADLLERNLVQIEFENGNRLLPKVFIKDDIFNDLCLSWKDLLVMKLLGKEIGFYQMNTRLQKLLKFTGGFVKEFDR
ncbi:hypothetical protein NC651_007972 [Populus alba x Populus x berolinensis]|nr:hypothetical protein NC651_007972 [Populus alba x Populus x berolinensis]